MREIKFRAWDRMNQEMIYDFYIHSTGRWNIFDSDDGGKAGLWEHDVSQYHDLEIMQYTGLLDKTGREIYEGDILEYEDEESKKGCSIVKWEMGCWYCWPQRLATLMLNKYWSITGNIYENPELLEKEVEIK